MAHGARIAKGAGVEVSEVNTLINRFFEARKMMSPWQPGMPGMLDSAASLARRQAGSQKKKGGRGVSGNPAKRNAAQQPAAAVDPAAAFGAARIRPGRTREGDGRLQPPELRSRFGK